MAGKRKAKDARGREAEPWQRSKPLDKSKSRKRLNLAREGGILALLLLTHTQNTWIIHETNQRVSNDTAVQQCVTHGPWWPWLLHFKFQCLR